MFTHINSGGVPMNALLATAAIGAVGFIAALLSPDGAYLWLVNVSGLAGFITWVGIAVAHYRFRRAYLKQGHSLKELPYVAPFFPVGPIIAFLMCLVVIGGQNYEAIISGDWFGVLSSYIGLPVVAAVWLGHRIVTRDRLIPLEEMDVSGLEVGESK
jgi:amino acid transporter